LRDTLLDWEDELPKEDLENAERHCSKADLVLCLGTSLRIEPAASLPLLAKRFVIVNLQKTPKDDSASLIIHAKVDDVISEILKMIKDHEDYNISTETISESSSRPTLPSPPAIERVWQPPKAAKKEIAFQPGTILSDNSDESDNDR